MRESIRRAIDTALGRMDVWYGDSRGYARLRACGGVVYRAAFSVVRYVMRPCATRGRGGRAGEGAEGGASLSRVIGERGGAAMIPSGHCDEIWAGAASRVKEAGRRGYFGAGAATAALGLRGTRR